MDKTNYRTDCFAHKGTKCSALKVMNCHNCNFYKKAGMECNTCQDKGKESCKHCRKE